MSLCHFVGIFLDLSPAVTSGPESDELSLSIVDSAFLLKQFIEVQQKKSLLYLQGQQTKKQKPQTYASTAEKSDKEGLTLVLVVL